MVTIKQGVLILSPFYHPNIGGVETHLNDLVGQLDSRGYRVFVHTYSPLTTKINYKNHETINNIEIYRYKWFGQNLFHKLENYPLLDFIYLTPYLFIRTLFWLISNHSQVNIIHAHGINASLCGILLKKIFKLRLITSIHAIYEVKPTSITAKLTAAILNQNDHVLSLSKASYRQLLSFGVKPEPLTIFHYWINLNYFKPKNDLKYSKFTVLYVGRLIAKKGVKVLADLAYKLTDINFVFIGTGPESTYLSKISKNNLNINFLGAIPNNRLAKYYHRCHLLCIPSLYQEGFGRVVMEAVACGLPVVGSNLGGLTEAVDKSISILTDPKPEKLVVAIKKIKKPVTYKKMQAACRAYAQNHFSSTNINDIIKHY